MIDGVDVAKIGLHDLRSRLTIIPQVINTHIKRAQASEVMTTLRLYYAESWGKNC